MLLCTIEGHVPPLRDTHPTHVSCDRKRKHTSVFMVPATHNLIYRWAAASGAFPWRLWPRMMLPGEDGGACVPKVRRL